MTPIHTRRLLIVGTLATPLAFSLHARAQICCQTDGRQCTDIEGTVIEVCPEGSRCCIVRGESAGTIAGGCCDTATEICTVEYKPATNNIPAGWIAFCEPGGGLDP